MGFTHSPFTHWIIDTYWLSVFSVTGWSWVWWVTGDPDNNRHGVKDTDTSTGNPSSVCTERFLPIILYQQEWQCSLFLYSSISILNASLSEVIRECIHYPLLSTSLFLSPPFNRSSLLLAQSIFQVKEGIGAGESNCYGCVTKYSPKRSGLKLPHLFCSQSYNSGRAQWGQLCSSQQQLGLENRVGHLQSLTYVWYLRFVVGWDLALLHVA